MARTSQTELAVLGALSVEPMTGYRLRAAIGETLGHFWHESFGQIYPTLSLLTKAGLVVRDDQAADGKPAFRITAEGEGRLVELLAEPFSRPAPRDPLLLRLFFGRHVDPDLVRRWLVEAQAEAESRVAAFDALRKDVEGQLEENPDAVFWLMTLSAGEHGARAGAAWARDALLLLDRASQPG